VRWDFPQIVLALARVLVFFRLEDMNDDGDSVVLPSGISPQICILYRLDIALVYIDDS